MSITSLGKRSPAFVTSHFSASENWLFGFAGSSPLLLMLSRSLLLLTDTNQSLHAAGASRACPTTQASRRGLGSR